MMIDWLDIHLVGGVDWVGIVSPDLIPNMSGKLI